jgi:hypothetical protein
MAKRQRVFQRGKEYEITGAGRRHRRRVHGRSARGWRTGALDFSSCAQNEKASELARAAVGRQSGFTGLPPRAVSKVMWFLPTGRRRLDGEARCLRWLTASSTHFSEITTLMCPWLKALWILLCEETSALRG